jgi:hypothetical protein
MLKIVYDSGDYSSSVSSGQYWYLDTGKAGQSADVTVGHLTRVAVAGAVGLDTADYNEGHVKRLYFCRAPSRFTVRIPLKEIFGFCRDVAIPMIGIQQEIEFTRETSMTKLFYGSTALDTTNGPNDITFTNAQIWMPKIRPSSVLEADLLGKIQSGWKQRVAYKDYTVYQSGLLAGADLQWDIPVSTKRPSKVHIAFKLDVQTTSALRNGGVFPNLDITNLYIEVNGKRFPEREIVVDYANKDYTRAYHNLLAVIKGDSKNSDVGCSLTYRNFADNYAIYSINLDHLDALVFENVTITSIRLNARTTGAQNRYAYACVESYREAEFSGYDRTMNVKV